MSRHEVELPELLGRVVHDAAGERVGRIEEMRAEIVVHERGNDYVVVEYHVGAYGWLEHLAGGAFARSVLRTAGRVVAYRSYRVPWDWMDLSDPAHPRLTRRRSELRTD